MKDLTAFLTLFEIIALTFFFIQRGRYFLEEVREAKKAVYPAKIFSNELKSAIIYLKRRSKMSAYYCPHCEEELDTEDCEEAGQTIHMIHPEEAFGFCGHDDFLNECPLQEIPEALLDHYFFKDLKEAFEAHNSEDFDRLIEKINLTHLSS